MNDSSKHIKLLTGALKKCSVLLCAIQLLFGFELLHAQVIRNNGTAVKISSGAVVTGKDLENAADTITNNGTIELKGNWTNTAAYQPGMGTVVFNGNDTIADQLITKTGGETFHDFIVNRGFLFFLRTVKLNNDVTVNNALNLISGRLNLNAKNLTVEGPITSTTGTITGHDSSNIIVNGSGAIGTITFTSGSGVIHDFKLMRANNTAALGSDLAVGGHFAIADTLGLSNDLTLNGTDECGGFINASAGTVTYASNGLIVINGTYSNLTIAQNAVMCSDVTVNGTLAFTNGVLDLNGHTLTLNGSTSLAAGTIKGGSTSNIIISSSNNSGMLLPQISGGLNNLTINKTGTTNTVTLSNALNIAGNATLSNGVLITAYNINFNGTTTCGSGSINATTDTATFNNVSYVFPGNYNNLLKIGASTATLCGNVGISGNLTVSTGTFEITSYSISVSGTTNVYGILSDNNISGTNLFVGPVTIYAGGAWNFSGNGAAELRNGLTYNGVSFNSGTGAYSFTKNYQNIAGSSQIVFNGSVLIGTNVTLTNNNSFAVSGVTFKAALNGTDGTSKYVNQVITSYEGPHSAYGAPMSTGILDATYTGNTFRYSGAVQDITAGTYYYLEINGSGSKTFNGNVNVNSDLNVLNGTTIAFGSASIYTMDIKGNFNASNGAINMTNGTNINHKLILEGLNNSCNLLNADDQSEIQYIGENGQQVFGSTNYRNIVFGGTGTKVLQGNVTASGNTITLNTMVSTGPYVLYLSIPTVTINRSTGVVIGNLKRSVNTTSYNYSFAVGTDTSFNPLQIKFTNLTSGDYLVNFKTGNIGNAGLPLNDHGVEIYAMFTNGYWSTQASNSLASSNYSITLTTSGFGIDSSSRILKKEGGNLFVNGINGGISGLDITRNTLNEISPTNTSFAIGQGRPNISTQPLNDTVCHEATAQFFVGATGVGTLTYQWFKTGSPDIQLSNTGNIKGATSSTLFIDNANFADDGYYYCIITDANGHPKESNPAILVVNTIPVLTLVKPVDTICNAQYAKITIAPAVSDTTYSWTVQPDAGISGAKSGGGILINQIITNSNNYVAKVIYVITPMGPKPTYCVGLSKYDTIWVNPTAILRVNTQDTILCDSSTFTISVDDRNGAVKGSKVYQLTTTYYTDSLGGVEQSTTDIIAGTDITNRIVNNTKNLQKVTYNFKPMIKNPHQGVSYCNISKDTSITIYVNPTPQMSIKSDTVFCDSASVNLILASLNGTILGDKYYQITTTFNNSKAVVNNTMNGTFPIHSFSNQLINKTIGLDTIFYNVVPVFRNPRKNDTTEFCSVGVPVIFRRYVLPALKAILIDTTYAGGSNNTIKCYGDKNLSYKDKNNKNVVHLAIPNNTGKIKAMISGGLTVPPYSQLQDNCTFSWSNNSNTRIISGLNAGTYSLSVTDGHGCKTGAKTVLTNPPKLISEDTIIQGFKCSSATKGIMLATPVGGTKPYSYEWATVDGRIVFNDTVTDLVEGTQTLYITDANGCMSTNSDILQKESIPQAELGATQYGKYNISCYGYSNGSFYPTFNSQGGNLIYTWYRVEPNGSQTKLQQSVKNPYLLNQPKGLYSFSLTNPGLGCNTALSYDSLTEPGPINVNAQLSSFYNNQYNLSCDNSMDGKIALKVSGGQGNFMFKWKTFGKDTVSTRNTFINNLDSGKYNLTIVDSAQIIGFNQYVYCYKDTSYSLTKPTPLKLDTVLSHTTNWNVSCFNSSDGSVQAKVSGGVTPYSYKWQNITIDSIYPDTTNKITSLPADTYKLAVTYGKSCTTDWGFVLTQPGPLNISLKLKEYVGGFNVSCFGDSDGAAKAIVTGGAYHYKYYWYLSSTDTSKSFSSTDSANLLKAIQQYTFEVKDTNNCILKKDTLLTQPLKLDGYIESVNLSCKLSNNGWAFVIPEGGVPPYTYIWYNGATTDTVRKLAVGDYAVQITDTNTCIKKLSVTINAPDTLIVKAQVITEPLYHGWGVSCFGDSDASIKAIVIGGTPPYKYRWNDGLGTIDTISGIRSGIDTVLVIDTNGCSGKDIIQVTQPEKLTIDIAKTNVTCYDLSDGTATAIVNGGTLPYRYLWSDGQQDSVAKNLRAGKDSVKIFDANNCFIELSDSINQPNPLKFTFEGIKMPYCPATKDGTVKATGEGGTLPYNFVWSDSQKNSTADTLREGVYILTLIDSNKCTFKDTIKLKALHSACLDIPKAFTPNGDGYNDTWNILVGDPKAPVVLGALYPEAVVQVYNRWGEIIYQSEKGYRQEWDGTYKGRVVPMDSYYYSIDLGIGSEKYIGIVSIIR